MKEKHFVPAGQYNIDALSPEQSGHRQRVSQVSPVGLSRGMASGAGQEPSVLDFLPVNLHVISWRTCAALTSGRV